MQVQNNSNINFGRQEDIMYNLAVALEKSQEAAKFIPRIKRTTVQARDYFVHSIGEARAHITAARQDPEFEKTVRILESVLKCQTKPERGKQPLKTIANNQNLPLYQRLMGFNIFSKELHARAYTDLPTVCPTDIKKGLEAIKPDGELTPDETKVTKKALTLLKHLVCNFLGR